MQSQRARYRYRGYRESRPLVDLGKAAASDLTRLQLAAREHEQLAEENLRPHFTTLSEEQIRTLQHLRVQVAYRLRNGA